MRKFVYMTFLFLCLLLISCNGIGSGNAYIDTKRTNCKLVVQSQDNAINFAKGSGNQRTIMPEGVPVGSLYFYLWGKNKITGATLSPVSVQFSPTENETTGEIDFDFPNTTVYELYLGACKNDISTIGETESVIEAIKNSLYYIGFATADLRYSTKIVFFLTPYAVYNYAEKTGKVELKIYMPWEMPEGFLITAGLYDLYTDNEIHQQYTTDSGVISPSSVTGLQGSALFLSTPPESANYVVRDIKPGCYNLKIKFSGTQEYVYSDTIIVLANQTTAATVAVPNILEYKPSASPSGLTVAYAEPQNYYDGYYPAEFIWTDNSINETHFQLEIMDISEVDVNNASLAANISTITDGSSTASQKNAGWENLLTNYGKAVSYTPDYYGDSSVDIFKDINASGSLCMNNNFIVMNLLLGKKYLARICAVNRVGKTEYAYADLTNSCGQTLQNTGLSQTFNFWSGNPSSINLYKIRYIINEGFFYDSANAIEVTNQIPLTIYKNQDLTTAVQIMNPVNYHYSTAHPDYTATLRNENGEWVTWNTNSANGTSTGTGTGSSFTATYDGFDNITLFANYTADASSISPLTLNTNLFAYAGSSNTTSTLDLTNEQAAAQGRLTVTNDHFTIDGDTITDGSKKYLYIIVANPYTDSNQLVKTYSSVELEVSDKYGIPYEMESVNVHHNFTSCEDFIIDLTEKDSYNQDKFEAGTGKLYYITVRAVPRAKPTMTLYYTLKFTID